MTKKQSAKVENTTNKMEELQKLLDDAVLQKDQKHDELNNIFYNVFDRSKIKVKDFLYLITKIEWQGKESLGVIRINELMRELLTKKSSDKDNIVQMRQTEMNALLYLLLRIKGNSLSDAQMYGECIFPVISNLESVIVEAKSKYDEIMKPLLDTIDKLQNEIDEIELKNTIKEGKNDEQL